MSVISEIAAWAREQPEWVSDAMRRLFTQRSLDDSDIEDLAAMLLATQGFVDPKQRVAIALDENQLPQVAADSPAVSLVAIRNPRNVNAIGAPDGVAFEPDGLTIIYGYNGAGKSGYARALKRACRARNSEGIIPNIFSPPANPEPAQARFEWRTGNTVEADDWIDDGRPSPSALSRIAVFDSLCARVFVDDQAEVSYIPYGLDVLRELANGLQRVQKLVESHALGTKFDMQRLTSLHGDTAVGKLIGALKFSSDPKLVEALASLSADESDEQHLLTKLLRDEDPAKQAVALRRFAARIQSVENELTQLATPLSDEQISKLKLAFEQLLAAEAASKLAANALQEGGKALPGTGTNPWEVLVRSAVAFAAEQVYPGVEFPGPKDGASCVLCQQPLSIEATERLTNFVKFLETDAQKQYTDKRRLAGELYKAVAAANVNDYPSDQVFLDELTERVPEVASAIRTYLECLEARKLAIVAMAPNRRIDELAQLPSSPVTSLVAMREQMTEQATKLDKTLTPDERKVKTARLADLDARVKLSGLLPTVLDAIIALKRERAFAEAIKACSTAALTRKMNELYEKSVTAELRTALAAELKSLDVNTALVGLEMSGQRGARMQQAKLAAPAQFARVKPSGVLSEGEQRSLALASFLAEIGLEQDRSGIIFDDPVSSLDHIRRDRIAARLAQEAKNRQVVVFTHDLAFAWSLRDFAKHCGAKHAERHIFAAGPSKGHSQDSLPFEAKKLDARVNDLRTIGAKAKKALEQHQNHDAYNDIVRQGYRRMRDTWELLVEDLLFNGAVKRFRRSVETQRLNAVLVEDADVYSVSEGMTRCSYFTHEGGAEAPPPLPSPDEFLADIEALGTTVASLLIRIKEVELRRKKEGVPA